MNYRRLPLWYRHAWWLPGTVTALAVRLAAATQKPAEHGVMLFVAILCALPWSLALLLLDLGQGFAERGAVIVSLGLAANTALVWGTTALLRARLRRRLGLGLVGA
ncbi:hypothetical protein [Variovorax sp. RA8]|uniref:hypothetical protein n=1 Tax=Variovorax sp. (strain JCM 16519 / RA8) TaxID=662548 RepID=UPI000A5CCF69|nr:hypothetical protein [Variovorax sp. RA8]VTU41797.1 hypothetical protein RA8P1_00095 [Variovorax sp. RA8]